MYVICVLYVQLLPLTTAILLKHNTTSGSTASKEYRTQSQFTI